MIQNHLSPREKQVLELLLQGKSNKQIAFALGIAERTVEFHLKNVYIKHQVSSRVELILKLGNTAGASLREPTVGKLGEKAENRARSALWMGRAASFRDAVSTIGRELEMKNILNTKHVWVGMVTAMLTGLLWITLMRTVAHMALEEITPWLVPLLLIWALLGLTVGLIGRRASSSLLKVAFGTFFGAGASPVAILPLMGLVVLPLVKFTGWIGLVNRSAISTEAATLIAIILMLVIWLVVGALIGSGLQFVSIHKPGQNIAQLSEQHL